MSGVDVLVVGGGPGGAATAALAAAEGATVVVIERERFPRPKVCGEFVSAEGCAVLRRLGLHEPLLAAGAATIDQARVVDLAGRSLEADLPELPSGGRTALGVSRRRLDALLLEEAARRGADVRERVEARRPLVEDGRVTGCVVRRTGGHGGEEPLRAKLVVAADGRRSVVARALHPGLGDPTTSGPRSWFGLQAHLALPDPVDETSIDLYLFDRGYAGFAPIEGGLSTIGLLVTMGTLRACGSPDRLLGDRVLANPGARAVLRGGRRVGEWRGVGPLRFAPRRPVASGALFVGDAAGTIDPFCGEGISHALVGAELALPAIVDAVVHGALTGDAARRYEARWTEAFAGVTRRARWIGRLFERPRLGGAALALLAGPARRLAPRLVAATRTGLS